MRVLYQRYGRDIARYNLATRMIRHEARTRTIHQWSGLPEERIRNLYLSYAKERGLQSPVRHRGPSPQRVVYLLRSSRMRAEAAAFGALCYALEVIEAGTFKDAQREFPSLARGERLCSAFELYRIAVPRSQLTLEQAILVIVALVDGSELLLGHCAHCSGAIVIDPFGSQRRACGHCIEEEQGHLSVHRAPRLGPGHYEQQSLL